ncbi:pyruvate dehydrogenase [acetyl-transferring]-phosphatase 1, mitochondrial [Aplochiton taeniatus]
MTFPRSHLTWLTRDSYFLSQTSPHGYDLRLYNSSSVPQLELFKLHHPTGLGGNQRKYRAERQAGQMTVSQINHKLKANEHSYNVPRNSYDGRGPFNGVFGFHSNLLAANCPSEDRRSSATCLQSRGMLFGVFDGHAGTACAQAVSERLFYYFAVAMLPVRTLAEIEEAVEDERPVAPVLQWHKHPNDHSCRDAGQLYFSSLRTYWQERLDLGREELEEKEEEEDGKVSSALANAFRRLDNDISVEAQVDLSISSTRRVHNPGEALSLSSPLRVALSGCTACVAHVSGGELHVANLGDSRAVLGVKEDHGGWTALSLTNDHNAQNPDELQRILGEHPMSEAQTVVRHDRLLGLLMPFRAFGNVGFKWSGEMLSRVSETRPEVLSASEVARTMGRHYHTPPYLTAQPEVTRHRLRPKDKFLILATDGLWELMHRQTVVQLVGEHLTGLKWQKPVPRSGMTLGSMHSLLLDRKKHSLAAVEDQNAATHLIRHALGNDGYGGVEPRRLAKMLSLPPELTRMYRDDITVTVVHLNDPDI